MTPVTFDLTAAMSNVDDDPEFFRDVVATFERTHRKLLDEVSGALAAGDAARLERSAHTLKGALMAFSASASKLALQLETRGREGQTADCAPLFAELEKQVLALRDELHATVAQICP